MTETLDSRKPTAGRLPGRGHPVIGAGFDWAAAGLSAWMIGGLYLDGWAHHHGKVDEVFFTPWHAVLYSGSLAMLIFLLIAQSRNMSRGHAWRSALPRGYLLSLAGSFLFLLGGALDFAWHTAFGVEVDLETLLSPTHLFLAASGMLVICGPIRAAGVRFLTEEARGWKALGPAVITATLVLSVLTFFTHFAHPINQLGAENVSVNDQARISDIYLMKADGSGQTRLTASPDLSARYGAWSPDGRQVVFSRGEAKPGSTPESALYIMNADGSGMRQLTDMPGEEYVPAWSPDGRRIVFVSIAGRKQAICVIDVDGSNLRRVSATASSFFSPTWSPDGARILYSSNASGGDQIYIMNADGSNQTQVTTRGSHNFGAAWSPDGNRIAFASSSQTGLDIYTIAPDGRDETQLTHDPNDDYAPDWSPDGRQIAFITWHDGTADIYTMNSDGGNVLNLTHSHALEINFPKWSPDSQSLLFSASGHAQISNPFNNQSLAIAGILLQSAILMGVVLWLVRRWTLPFGALTLMFTLNGLLMSVFNDQTLFTLPMLGAGLCADILLWRLRPFAGRRGPFLLFAFLVPVAFYTLYFLLLQVTVGIGWTIHLWLGSIFMAGVLGIFLGFLTAPPVRAAGGDVN